MDKQVREEVDLFEDFIGIFLQVGVMVCAFIMADGLVSSWLLTGSRGFTPEDIEVLRSGHELAGAVVPRTFDAFHSGLMSADAGTVVSLGIIALIALPILRVALTCVLFASKKDFLYFGFTVVVLATLSIGIFFGNGL